MDKNEILLELAARSKRCSSIRSLREILGDDEILRLDAESGLCHTLGVFLADWVRDSAREIRERKPLRIQ